MFLLQLYQKHRKLQSCTDIQWGGTMAICRRTRICSKVIKKNTLFAHQNAPWLRLELQHRGVRRTLEITGPTLRPAAEMTEASGTKVTRLPTVLTPIAWGQRREPCKLGEISLSGPDSPPETSPPPRGAPVPFAE